MPAMVHEPLSEGGAGALLEGFHALDTPEGFRAELIDGEIVVSPPPIGMHESCLAKINFQVLRNSPREFHWSGNKGLLVPSMDRREQRVSLFSGPEGGDYRRVEWVPFGKTHPLPEPIDIELDTSRFA
ncbi:Uma2 family endonuclease [Actinomadura madurae]|uniref:hypothetical protein n=1 Tax=Actinomadura madurae TaxID=1993 RepID=UPI003999ED23